MIYKNTGKNRRISSKTTTRVDVDSEKLRITLKEEQELVMCVMIVLSAILCPFFSKSLIENESLLIFSFFLIVPVVMIFYSPAKKLVLWVIRKKNGN